MTATTYRTEQQVTIKRDITTEEGYEISAGATGWLMTDLGDGQWLVYVPGNGSPEVSEADFSG